MTTALLSRPPAARRADVVDELRRRELLTALAAAGLLAGCSDDEPAPGGSGGRRVVDELGVPVDVPDEPRLVAVVDRLVTAALLVDLGTTGLVLAENSSLSPELMPPALERIALVVEASFLYPFDDGTVSLSVLAGDPVVDPFTSAGFRVPEELSSQPLQDSGLLLSFEQLDRVGGVDLLVVTHYAPAGAVFTGSVLARSPLYQGLPVVADGRVLVVQQGPQAQALATMGPLNVDVVLPLVREGARILRDGRA